MALYYSICILVSLSCSASQLLLKTSAGQLHKSRIYEILNVKVFVAYSVLFVSLLVNIWLLSKGIQLKELGMLESLGYVFVPLLSWLVLKEQITKRTIFSILMIIAGIIVFYL